MTYSPVMQALLEKLMVPCLKKSELRGVAINALSIKWERIWGVVRLIVGGIKLGTLQNDAIATILSVMSSVNVVDMLNKSDQ